MILIFAQLQKLFQSSLFNDKTVSYIDLGLHIFSIELV